LVTIFSRCFACHGIAKLPLKVVEQKTASLLNNVRVVGVRTGLIRPYSLSNPHIPRSPRSLHSLHSLKLLKSGVVESARSTMKQGLRGAKYAKLNGRLPIVSQQQCVERSGRLTAAMVLEQLTLLSILLHRLHHQVSAAAVENSQTQK
jgi:hypothetical protein